jgi:hypothetical protein
MQDFNSKKTIINNQKIMINIIFDYKKDNDTDIQVIN